MADESAPGARADEAMKRSSSSLKERMAALENASGVDLDGDGEVGPAANAGSESGLPPAPPTTPPNDLSAETGKEPSFQKQRPKLKDRVGMLEDAAGVDLDGDGAVGKEVLMASPQAWQNPGCLTSPSPLSLTPAIKKRSPTSSSSLKDRMDSLESASGVDLDGDGTVGAGGAGSSSSSGGVRRPRKALQSYHENSNTNASDDPTAPLFTSSSSSSWRGGNSNSRLRKSSPAKLQQQLDEADENGSGLCVMAMRVGMVLLTLALVAVGAMAGAPLFWQRVDHFLDPRPAAPPLPPAPPPLPPGSWLHQSAHEGSGADVFGRRTLQSMLGFDLLGGAGE